ncbi:hypothetical protein SADUNF_Sadunf02G0106000 [Salix dunnii]|uniref:Uncharacterized protein n=1 Tax=Salix dunnii TaxID=1413687 RepID=A0A835N7G8_9ROSI|nr:hypothetical protein SADUNF_Sadunf02G0106000 [Salix dunnii]
MICTATGNSSFSAVVGVRLEGMENIIELMEDFGGAELAQHPGKDLEVMPAHVEGVLEQNLIRLEKRSAAMRGGGLIVLCMIRIMQHVESYRPSFPLSHRYVCVTNTYNGAWILAAII